MASKRRLNRAARKKECGTKVRYASKAEAERACRDVARREKKHLSGYRCRFCGFYHWGHTPREDLIALREGNRYAG